MNTTQRSVVAFLLSALALTGRAQVVSAEPKPGDRAPSGNLIVHVFHRAESGKPIPAELKTDSAS